MVGKIIPEMLGFELASFLDEKSRLNFLVQCHYTIYVIKTEKVTLDFLSRNDASSVPKIPQMGVNSPGTEL